jgi:hypothetical protein
MLLLGKHLPQIAPARLLNYFHAYLEVGIDKASSLDWAELVTENMSREILSLLAHLHMNYSRTAQKWVLQ